MYTFLVVGVTETGLSEGENHKPCNTDVARHYTHYSNYDWVLICSYSRAVVNSNTMFGNYRLLTLFGRGGSTPQAPQMAGQRQPTTGQWGGQGWACSERLIKERLLYI